MTKAFINGSLLIATALAFGTATPALSQTASQITPASVRPTLAPTSGPIAIPELAGPAAPKGAAGLKVRLSGVSIGGGLAGVDTDPAVTEARSRFAAAMTGRTVTVAEIFAAAQALEAAYGQAGFVLTRIVVPAQKLKTGGRLKVVVIDGFIERIETRDVPAFVKARIEAVLAPVVGRRSIRLAEIERALVLAADTPGTRLKSTLASGTQTGGSILIVEARHKLVTGSLSIDNTLASSLGRIDPTLSLQVNSPFGFGEQIYGQVAGFPAPGGSNSFFGARPTNRQWAAGVVLPLGIDGWSANLEAIRTDSAPNASAGQSFYSSFERFSGRLRYAVVRSRAFNIFNEGSLDIEEERLSSLAPLAAPISLDRLRVLRDTTDVSAVTSWGALISGRLVASVGLDALGARSAADATALLPLSRQGADDDFGKVEASIHYGQLLAPHFGIDLFARAQTSFGRPLPRAEQIGIATSDGLTAFDAGTFQGDSGLVGRAELVSPWSLDLSKGVADVSPYAFGDIGSVWLMQPTALEQRQTTAGSIGLGLRIAIAPFPSGTPRAGALSNILDQATVSLEWGHQYRTDGTRAGDRFTISSAIQF